MTACQTINKICKFKSMNQRTFFRTLIFAVLFIVGSSALVMAQDADPPVLARVELTGRVDELNLPVYAHLQGADGRDYALVISPLTQLEKSGVD